MADHQQLVDILTRYRESSQTHDQRLVLLLEKQKRYIFKVSKLLVDALSSSPEQVAIISSLLEQSGELAIQFGETLQDMASDTDILMEFFRKEADFRKEEKK